MRFGIFRIIFAIMLLGVSAAWSSEPPSGKCSGVFQAIANRVIPNEFRMFFNRRPRSPRKMKLPKSLRQIGSKDEENFRHWQFIENTKLEKFFSAANASSGFKVKRKTATTSNNLRNLTPARKSIVPSKHEQESFNAHFEASLIYAEHFKLATDRKGFLKWWSTERSTVLSNAFLAELIKEDYTLGRLRHELYIDYVREKAKQPRLFFENIFVEAVSNRYTRVAIYSVAKASWALGGFLGGLIMAGFGAGPIARVINALVDSPVTVVANKTNQFGTVVLQTPTRWLDSWLNQAESDDSEAALSNEEKLARRQAKIKAAKDAHVKLSSVLEQFANFKGMDPKKAEAKWNELLNSYSDYFVRVTSILPPHLREHRNTWMGAQIFTPVDWAVRAQTFQTPINAAENQKNTLLWQLILSNSEAVIERVEKARSNNEPITAADLASYNVYLQQAEEIKRQQLIIDHNKQALASVLASWKINEFVYRDLYEDNERSSRGAIYHRLCEYIGFGMYIAEVEKEMRAVLDDIGFYMDTGEIRQDLLKHFPIEVQGTYDKNFMKPTGPAPKAPGQ